MWMAPLFLIGLLGIGVPLWLHRFAKQTDQKHSFASSMFLEASEVRRSRRRELRYWLIVLAFAGPQWRVPVQAGKAGATLHVIVVDNSMSMRYAGVWDRARERANELIGGVRGADRMMLVAADHRLQVLHEAGFASEAGAFRAAIQNLQP